MRSKDRFIQIATKPVILAFCHEVSFSFIYNEDQILLVAVTALKNYVKKCFKQYFLLEKRPSYSTFIMLG